MVATAVWAVFQVLGEMTIAFPVSGNFIDYADRFVHPSIAFAAGFAEWLGMIARSSHVDRLTNSYSRMVCRSWL